MRAGELEVRGRVVEAAYVIPRDSCVADFASLSRAGFRLRDARGKFIAMRIGVARSAAASLEVIRRRGLIRAALVAIRARHGHVPAGQREL